MQSSMYVNINISQDYSIDLCNFVANLPRDVPVKEL